tara:strand:+ start:9962 stop:10426 length:465 start_codon:yes stop_codon:yes gene_type:complete
MADKERIYTIPLRRTFLKSPKYKRTFRAVKTVRAYLTKHLKSDNVKLGKYLNQELWKRGMKNPPSKIQVKVIQDGETFKVDHINAPVEEPKKETKKKSLKERLGAKGKPEEKKEEPSKTEAKEEPKKEVKEAPKKTVKKETKTKESSKKEIKKN